MNNKFSIVRLSEMCCSTDGSGMGGGKTSPLKLKVSQQNDKNSVSLTWNSPDSSKRYSYMIYSKKSNEEFFQSIPAKMTVKVLNIYPGCGNNVKAWMENSNFESENGYGKGLISVDEVDVDIFNGNPDSYLKDENGEWKYDVVYIGAWDCNNNKDLSEYAVKVLESFIHDGRGFLAGHDFFVGNNSNQNFLAQYENIIPYCEGRGFGSDLIKISKRGLLTNYPWNVGEIGNALHVPMSHTSQMACGDVWMKYEYNKWDDLNEINYFADSNCTNNFYLTTWNNTAMIQTGHSGGGATADEQKVLANTLFYLSQITEETSWEDHKGQDVDAPEKPVIKDVSCNKESEKITVSYDSCVDFGTEYEYFVEATDLVTRNKIKSNTQTITVKSGLKGYIVTMDNNPDTIPSGDITTTSTIAVLPVSDTLVNDIYIHVSAVDNCGNISEPCNYKIESLNDIDDSRVVLNVEPVNNEVHVQEIVEADIVVDNIKNISGEDIKIKYDSTKLEFISMKEVDGVKVTWDVEKNNIIRVIMKQKEIKTEDDLKKVLLKLYFKGTSSGKAVVDIISGKISDSTKAEKQLKSKQCGQCSVLINEYKVLNKDKKIK